MKDLIVSVCGVAASGKTYFAKKIAINAGFEYVSLGEFAVDVGAVIGFDQNRDCKIIDEDILSKEVETHFMGCVVLDGVLAHLCKASHYVSLRCPLDILVERMRKRGYGKDKILENVEVEYLGLISDACINRSENVFEVWGNEEADMDKVRSWLDGGGKKLLEPDHEADFGRILDSL